MRDGYVRGEALILSISYVIKHQRARTFTYFSHVEIQKIICLAQNLSYGIGI